MDYQVLWTEISTDPLARGYSGMTDAQIAASLNEANRTRNRTTLSSAEIYEAIDISEFQAKTEAQRVFVRDILGLGGDVHIGPGTKARMVLANVFGAGSNTVASLVAVAQETISRAQELGLSSVSEGHIVKARRWGADN